MRALLVLSCTIIGCLAAAHALAAPPPDRGKPTDSSQPSTPVVLDANGAKVGAVVGVDGEGLTVSIQALVEGPRGIVPVLLRVVGPVSLGTHEDADEGYYSSIDCQGQLYIYPLGEGKGVLPGLSEPYGVTGGSGGGWNLQPDAHLILPTSTVKEMVVMQSRYRSEWIEGSDGNWVSTRVCVNMDPTYEWAMEVLPAAIVETPLYQLFPPPYRWATQ